MKKRVQKLHEALVSEQMITYHLAAASELKHYGYVVGVGASFALIQVVDANIVCLNGYFALPLTEMRKVVVHADDYLLYRALEMKKIRPEPQPDILLLDFPGLLSSANAHFPLINVQVEYRWPDTCYIGRVDTLTKNRVRLREIDPEGQWSRNRSYRFKDITRVEFGGGYENALWMVAEHDRRRSAPQG